MKVLTIDDVIGCIKETELPQGENLLIENYINGLYLKGVNEDIIRIQRGHVFINNYYHYLPAFKNIALADMNYFGGTAPLTPGVFFIYVKNKGGGELTADDFYFSELPPAVDAYFKLAENWDMRSALYANYPQHTPPGIEPEYRCLGGIYIKDVANVKMLPFDLSFLGYWESKWFAFDEVDFKRNRINTLNHGLGMIPKSWNVWFKPEASNKAVAFNNFYVSGGWVTTTRGCMLGGQLDRDTIKIKAGKRVFYYDAEGTSGWFNKGYIKWIVRGF